MRNFFIPLMIIGMATSCVSKKKYVALEENYNNTRGTLQKTTLEKEALEKKFAKIEKRVENYNKKINSLRGVNSDLQKENDVKLDLVGNVAVISNTMKVKMRETLAKVDPSELANAKTLKDSLNIAVAHNLKKSIDTSSLENSDDVNINIDQTVVMISVSDKLLFNTASYRVNRKAYKLLSKLADVIKSEPSMDVMIEGHTDSRSIHNEVIEDNWDLSVKRATSIVRLLEKKYRVDPSRLIASGRGSSVPLADNNSRVNRARNRRTRIVILPNLDKFFGLLAEEEVVAP
ncbi:flagellar motor protein MotB [Tenacibaculum maritimum]|uniref:OmpA/MotB family protein n=1 Tax=Tenacibaculum maritimum TaxID=107401 RepID=UPI0012E3FEB7|nr:flagellar motor protein MotB [Tenacibaculum maritimum]MCD9581603.1 OmpA family protein [Tenacibaculum maritimum]MCD9636095.1 OmpA family protein [Tenacibaculum maritimum]CAA0174177.1 Flagellar motor/Chemotaxis (MotB)-related lipoprotein precursor [Tenacibaculum maritimum]CAA0177292.1 Flagellar motor/Chemotaxis (MotB)-related lipoprotein precursor [Tenacibaculum maritimum]CAA0178859.1 Flagellar motor/Chemotaxis (MotB)-related lipoprotein precursor [Tenacibaculum maritimum]